jgi:hypothetical protein
LLLVISYLFSILLAVRLLIFKRVKKSPMKANQSARKVKGQKPTADRR